MCSLRFRSLLCLVVPVRLRSVLVEALAARLCLRLTPRFFQGFVTVCQTFSVYTHFKKTKISKVQTNHVN